MPVPVSPMAWTPSIGGFSAVESSFTATIRPLNRKYPPPT